MRSSGHLMKPAGREFAKNLIWMAVVFGSLAAILVAATDLPLIGAMAFVGVSVAVVAAIVTWLCSGAEPAMRHPSVATTTLACLPTVVIGPVAAVGMVVEETVAAGVAAKVTFTPIYLYGQGGCGGRSC